MDERRKARKVAYGTLAVLVPLCLAVVAATAAESMAWWEVLLGTVLLVVFLCCVIGALAVFAGMLWERVDPEAEDARVLRCYGAFLGVLIFSLARLGSFVGSGGDSGPSEG
jgi:hypothetical protein